MRAIAKQYMTQPKGAVLFAALLFWTILPVANAQRGSAFGKPDDYIVAVLAGENRAAFDGGSELQLGGLSFSAAESQRNVEHREKSFSVVRHVRLRVSRKSGSPGLVSLSAFLLRDCYPCKLKFDGIPLNSAPTMIVRSAPLNSTIDHRIEIEIPASMPAGALDAEIGWQVNEK
jgi:hypothetical protein